MSVGKRQVLSKRQERWVATRWGKHLRSPDKLNWPARPSSSVVHASSILRIEHFVKITGQLFSHFDVYSIVWVSWISEVNFRTLALKRPNFTYIKKKFSSTSVDEKLNAYLCKTESYGRGLGLHKHFL